MADTERKWSEKENYPFFEEAYRVVYEELKRQAWPDGFAEDGQAWAPLHTLDGKQTYVEDMLRPMPSVDEYGHADFVEPDMDAYMDLHAYEHLSSAFHSEITRERDKDGLSFFICDRTDSGRVGLGDPGRSYDAVFDPQKGLGEDTKNILIATDFASASILSEASGRPVICAVNSGKACAIAAEIGRLYPDRNVHVFDDGRTLDADTDLAFQRDDIDLPKNVRIHEPLFSRKENFDRQIDNNSRLTFADLAEFRGLEGVQKQLGELSKDRLKGQNKGVAL